MELLNILQRFILLLRDYKTLRRKKKTMRSKIFLGNYTLCVIQIFPLLDEFCSLYIIEGFA